MRCWYTVLVKKGQVKRSPRCLVVAAVAAAAVAADEDDALYSAVAAGFELRKRRGRFIERSECGRGEEEEEERFEEALNMPWCDRHQLYRPADIFVPKEKEDALINDAV